ncbi:MAG: antitoxin [Kiritimatiellia bacterium]|jgi:hypothetical protein|nr:antitoxin [Kiritimatiellia bacterium]MDP6811362.1 antitoxin [Kiritimatiellia bacterium]MDP7024403.1 antitoxin [Kiritimatiellia bacterium]
MKRTQVQIPDWLFAAAHELAEAKEISLAELVRRGLEYMLAVTPKLETKTEEWALPEARNLQSRDPFVVEGWRASIHMQHLRVAEDGESYDAGGES